METTDYFTDIRRIVAGTINDLDGNTIIAPDGEIVGNSEMSIADLRHALACLDILEYRFPLPVDTDGNC